MNIKEFTTSINNKGILKNNKYLVTFGFQAGHYLNERASELRLLQARCDSVTLPGMSFASADGPPRLGYGPMEKHPYSATFEDLSLTFITDSRSEVHKTLFDWVNVIVDFKRAAGATRINNRGGAMNSRPYEVGYRDKYAATLTVSVYRETGEKTMTFEAYNVFPMGFPSAGLNWNEGDLLRLTIPFAYTDYNVRYEGTADSPVETGTVDRQVREGVALNTVELPSAFTGQQITRNA